MAIDENLNEISNNNLCTNSVNLNSQKIINVANGSNANDAVNFS